MNFFKKLTRFQDDAIANEPRAVVQRAVKITEERVIENIVFKPSKLKSFLKY